MQGDRHRAISAQAIATSLARAVGIERVGEDLHSALSRSVKRSVGAAVTHAHARAPTTDGHRGHTFEAGRHVLPLLPKRLGKIDHHGRAATIAVIAICSDSSNSTSSSIIAARAKGNRRGELIDTAESQRGLDVGARRHVLHQMPHRLI
jgi:hypothetical protein